MDQMLNLTVALSSNGASSSSDFHQKHTNSSINQLALIPLNESKTTLMEINDDCLNEIFHHMNGNDLLALAETNKRFREIARYVLSQKVYSQLFAPTYNYALCERILRNFGDIFNFIYVYGNHNEEFWSFMSKYSQRTSALHFEHCEISNILYWTSAFANAEKLIFESCRGVENISSDQCKELELMHLNFEEFRSLENADYPKLVRLKIKSCRGLNNIAGFIQRHSHIQTFELKGFEVNQPSLFAAAVLDSFEDLRELYIDGQLLTDIYEQFSKKLKYIKKLTIGDINTTYMIFLKHLASPAHLEYLQIDTGNLNRAAFQIINRFANIRSLKMTSLFIENVDNFEALKNFTKLTKLDIDGVYLMQNYIFFQKYNIKDFMDWFPKLENLILNSPSVELNTNVVYGPKKRQLNVCQFERNIPQQNLALKYGTIKFF